MSWNGFPSYISKENETEIFFRLPYAGSKCEQLVKRCLKINVKFVVTYNTKIISFYCNVKDKVSHEQRNNIIVELGVLVVVENTSEKQKDVSFLV